VGHDDLFFPIASPKFRRTLPGIVLWPMSLFPEVSQHVDQKSDAQAIYY
jgi:hypothetical protein